MPQGSLHPERPPPTCRCDPRFARWPAPAPACARRLKLSAGLWQTAITNWNEAGQRWWGLAELAPADAKKGGDKRFAAPEWHENPVYRTHKEMYLLLDVLTHRHQIQQMDRLANRITFRGDPILGRVCKLSLVEEVV